MNIETMVKAGRDLPNEKEAGTLLDELAQIDPRAAGGVAYMLANGSGKARAGRAGAARERASWRALALSAGEIELAEHMGEASQKPRAGQEICPASNCSNSD